MSESESWTNWAGNQTHDVTAIDHPSSVDRLTTLVAEAAANSERMKAVGAGHSFTGIALTNGRCLVLDRLDRVLDIDASSGLVSVQAGITLAALNDALAEAGLAFPNLGDIDRQTISGAIATSTHGTGAEWGGLATFVEAMTLVTGRRARSPDRRERRRPALGRARRTRRARHRRRGDASVRARVRAALHRGAGGDRADDGGVGRRGRRARPLRVLVGAVDGVGADEGEPPRRLVEAGVDAAARGSRHQPARSHGARPARAVAAGGRSPSRSPVQ